VPTSIKISKPCRVELGLLRVEADIGLGIFALVFNSYVLCNSISIILLESLSSQYSALFLRLITSPSDEKLPFSHDAQHILKARYTPRSKLPITKPAFYPDPNSSLVLVADTPTSALLFETTCTAQ
jgi:hypothetical protein